MVRNRAAAGGTFFEAPFRDRVVIATKLGFEVTPSGERRGLNPETPLDSKYDLRASAQFPRFTPEA